MLWLVVGCSSSETDSTEKVDTATSMTSETSDTGPVVPPTQIALTDFMGCRLVDGALSCWGCFDEDGQSTDACLYSCSELDCQYAYQDPPAPDLPISRIGRGREGGICLELPTRWECGSYKPIGQFRAVSKGHMARCTVDEDGVLVCVRSDDTPIETPPGRYDEVCIGFGYGCAVTEQQEVRCWDTSTEKNPEPTPTPPKRKLTGLSCALDVACGLDRDGEAVCFAHQDRYETGILDSVPDGPFTKVVVSGRAACGLRDSSTVSCWGGAQYPQYFDGFPWFEGDFVDVDTYGVYGCAIREDGTTRCWGHDEVGEGSPPDP